MDFSQTMSEERIRKAIENGDFDHLPGYGKPLKLDDLSAIPEELRMAYTVLKNAGYSPEEYALKQEMMSIESLLNACDDDEQKLGLQKKINEKMLRYNSMLSKRRVNTNSSIFKNYEQKINKKLF
ncbi:DnaJ family domain-containing protein [Robertmurraya sp. GLU-23]